MEINDIVIMHSPYTNGDTEVSFRGNSGPGKAMIYNQKTGSQIEVPIDWLSVKPIGPQICRHYHVYAQHDCREWETTTTFYRNCWDRTYKFRDECDKGIAGICPNNPKLCRSNKQEAQNDRE